MKWRQVVGFEGRYEVSSSGQVRSLLSGKILKPACGTSGYMSVCLYPANTSQKRRVILVHRLVADAFLGAAGTGLHVNHVDGDKRNNSLQNLELVTQQENNIHAIGLGNSPWSPTRKTLTERQVRFVRRVLAMDCPRGTKTRLARRLGVFTKTITDIEHGRKYKEFS